MLQIIKVSQEHQKLKYFEQEFDQYQDLWIVNDLRSKISLQQTIIKKEGFFLTESILRVQDFWQLLFLATDPEFKIVSRLFIETWIQQEIIANQAVESLLYRQSPSFILSLIHLLSPIYFDEKGTEQLSHYFAQNPESAAHWQDLAQVGKVIFDVIVSNKKWLLADWLPHYFLQYNEIDWSKVINKRNLYIDLGVDLKTSEAQLILLLSQNNEINIFEPIFNENNKHIDYIKAPYQTFSKFKAIKVPIQKLENQKIEIRGYSTELTQLKSIIAETKRLINQQISPSLITWVLPDIESVWPVLKMIADREELPINRPIKIKIKDYAVVAQWLNRLKFIDGKCEISVVEQLKELDSINQQAKVSQLKNIHLRFELPEPITVKLANIKIDLDQLLSVKDFIEFIYQQWSDKDQSHLFWKIVDAIFKDISEKQLFRFSAWFEILSSIVGKVEILEQEGLTEGIQLLNLNEFNLNQSKHVFILSLTESYLTGSEHVHIKNSEFERLGWDYGYFLDHPNVKRQVADLQWIIQSGWPNLWLTSFHIDLKGMITSYHVKFLEAQIENSSNQSEDMISQWDTEMRSLSLNSDNLLPTYQTQKQLKKFKQRIGVTAFNQYAICQFSGVADQIYQLKHLPIQDLDLDKRELGTLHHGLIENLLKNFNQWIDLKEFVTKFLVEKGVKTQDHSAFIVFAQRFVDFEQSRRQNFALIQVYQIEMPFDIYLNVTENKIQLTRPKDNEDYLQVSGKIDRVDIVNQHYVVIDYKSYTSNDFNFSKWLDSRYYQLAIYGLAVELTQDIQNNNIKWGGAEIINYSKMVREGGFILSECVGFYADKQKPRKPLLNNQSIEDFKKVLTAELLELARQYLAGQSAPNVIESKKSNCNRCDWRMLCRAPHLDI